MSSHSQLHYSCSNLDYKLLWSVIQLHLQAKFFPQGATKKKVQVTLAIYSFPNYLVFRNIVRMWAAHIALQCHWTNVISKITIRGFFFLKVYWRTPPALWEIFLPNRLIGIGSDYREHFILLIYLAFTSFWGILFQHLGIIKLEKVLLSPHLTWCPLHLWPIQVLVKFGQNWLLSVPFTMLDGRTQILNSNSKYFSSWPVEYFWYNK